VNKEKREIIFSLLFFIFLSQEINAQPNISSIIPNIGINKGTICVTILGSDFNYGAMVILTKNGTSIMGTPTIVEANTITTTFDLKNAPIGSWNVVVINPPSNTGTLTDGFKVIPQLLITEVYYNTKISGEPDEFIEIYNPTLHLINLSGYKLSDLEGTLTFPTGSVLPSYATITIAQKGTMAYSTLDNKYPDFEFINTSSNIPEMSKIGSFELSNTWDDVILLDNTGVVIDIVVYGTKSYPGVIPYTNTVTEGKSLQREPPNQDTDDCSKDFVAATPTATVLRNILVSPISGTVGSFVTISGKGFFATEGIIIDFGTTSTIATTTTDGSGSFSTTFTATFQPDFGTVTVSAKGLNSQAKVTTKFNIIPLPLLEFRKEVTPSGSATPGATLTYTLYYENVGLGTATNVTLTDAIPAGTIYITGSTGTNTGILYSHDGGINYDGDQSTPVTHIRWNLNDIAPGGSGNVSFAVRIVE